MIRLSGPDNRRRRTRILHEFCILIVCDLVLVDPELLERNLLWRSVIVICRREANLIGIRGDFHHPVRWQAGRR